MEQLFNILITIAGFLIGLVIVGLLTSITLFFYFRAIKKHGRSKVIPRNIQAIIIIFLIVLVIHIGCVAAINFGNQTLSNPDKWAYAISNGLKEIFIQIGGLTFEGQEFDPRASIAAIIYFATIAWLAISDAILIVIGVSYPIYSFISLKFSKTDNKDIFIFTYTTKDSLLLADSIKKAYKDEKWKKEHHKENKEPLIIFSSYEIAPFDKDNEVHFELSQSNYLFVSIPKDKFENRRSLLAWLFPKKAKAAKLLDFIKQNEISIFALAENDKLMGFESKNSDMVFDDIELVLKSLKNEANLTFEDIYQRIEQDKKCINYYVLSHTDINFEFYENELVKKFVEIFKKDEVSKPLLRQLPPLFNLYVLNEAIMSAEDLVSKRHAHLLKNKEVFLNKYNDETVINYQKDGHRCLVIGFGTNGQTALGHLYGDCIGGYLDDKHQFVPNKFFADVIDAKMDKLIASFIATHPSYVFNDLDAKEEDKKDKYATLKRFYKGFGFNFILDHMGFPEISYKKENFNSGSFLKRIDDVCQRKYDSVIIALGDDEKNIQCANAILLSLRQYSRENKKPLEIYVNIRDFHNEGRLLWNSLRDVKIQNNVFVCPFGNARNIYLIDCFDYTGAIRIDRTYQEINGEVYSEDSTEWKHHFLKACGLYERKTNAAAYAYGDIYKQYLIETKAFDKIKNSHTDFLAARKNATPMKNPQPKDILEHKDISPLYFDGFASNQYLGNMKKAMEYSFDGDRPKATLANYERLLSTAIDEKDYLAKDSVGYYWRYLIQFDHNRWCRHLMMYGRGFIQSFDKIIYDKEENKKDGDHEKYWKNYIRLHDCLLPYSSFTNFNTKPTADYLAYSEEDYDYGVVVAAIGLDAKKD